jgi:RTX calcium-binding nonapeptide repeat (4 copies)
MIFSRPHKTHRLLIIALAAAVLLVIPGAASTSERIVVHGAASGSHLKVSTEGSRIVVEGLMAHTQPQGCHFARGRMVAVCPMRGAGAIELNMGPRGDMVEILDRMPFPVTVHLGSGQDKFIGNAEKDTCYPEGTVRNRCIGRGGNDVCITGSRNSDCVGGGGDDYCRHGGGSDGCWGGPGNDICIMGPGQDGCHGEDGNDRLYGGAQPDRLYGGRGHDYCDGGPGWGKSQTCDAGPRR